MIEFLNQFTNGSYAPHGYCLLWQPELIWTHVIADALIAISYFSIPLALVHFIRQRRDMVFSGVFWLFALFILACGSSHVMGIWNLWNGDYGIEAIVKVITAAASVPTAIALWVLIPKALAIPSPNELRTANASLAALVAERDEALATLRSEIAQRERVEAALIQSQKIEAVGQLTGGIAHDFNNLLQAVSGNLELIQAKPDDTAKVRRWAGNAASVVERGTRLTGQLLAFSRTQRLDRKVVDLTRLLAGMRDLLARSLGPAVALDFDLDPETCPVVADATQIELAVLNLAINARDAMPGGGTLTIALRPGDGPGGESFAEISITDTGTGMSPEVAQRALEPFFTTKSPGEGTGLGLSMAFGVARQADGDLRIDTALGRGTTVTLALPCSVDSAIEDAVPSERAAASVTPRSVLLVDDDDDVRVALADALEAAGHRCHQAANGNEALTLLVQTAPDVLVADYAMPGMTGAEVVRRARGLQPSINVIFATGYADSAELEAVADENTITLRKPFSANSLLDAITSATER